MSERIEKLRQAQAKKPSPQAVEAMRRIGDEWCDGCRTYHQKPRDQAHHAELRCKAPWVDPATATPTCPHGAPLDDNAPCFQCRENRAEVLKEANLPVLKTRLPAGSVYVKLWNGEKWTARLVIPIGTPEIPSLAQEFNAEGTSSIKAEHAADSMYRKWLAEQVE